MSIKTYTSSADNKITGIRHGYAASGSYIIHASDNIVSTMFVNSNSNGYNDDQD